MKKILIPVSIGIAFTASLLFILLSGGREVWDGNVLLITLDTTRADSLGCYGDRDAQTPNIDRLAREGIRFENCYSPVPLTLPSHCTIFTGKYPPGHGVRNNGTYYLGEEESTLAEWFQNHGYQTHAVVAAFVLLSKFGLRQGFDTYDDSLDTHKMVNNFKSEIRADGVYEKFSHWFSRNGRRKFFSWVHFYDPHTPYNPPEGYFREEDVKDQLALYKGEIAYMDVYVGKIIDDLERAGMLERTLVIVVGDHGEAFGEHKEYAEHSIFCYEENIRVPLIFYNPSLIKEPAVMAERVDTAALAPTILEWVGGDLPEGTQGISLLPLLRGGEIAETPDIYFESMYGREEMGWAPLSGMIQGDYKFISLPRAELYDLGEDGGEKRNLFRIKNNISKRLDSRLREMVVGYAKKSGESRRELTEGDVRQLRSLGYISAFSQKTTGIVDPKDGIDLNLKLKEFGRLIQAGEWQEPERELNRILAENPEQVNHLVYTLLYQVQLRKNNIRGARLVLQEGMKKFSRVLALRIIWGMMLLDQGHHAEAIEAGLSMLQIDANFTRAHILLGDAYAETNQPEAVMKHFREAVRLEPENVSLKIKFAEYLIRYDRLPAALAVYNGILGNPDVWNTPKILYQIALFNSRHGTMERAEVLFKRVIELKPQGKYHYMYAFVLAKSGKIVPALKHMETAMNKYSHQLSPSQKTTAQQAIKVWRGNN